MNGCSLIVLAAAVGLVSVEAPPPRETGTSAVPLYGVFELTLTAQSNPSNPYLAMPGDASSPGRVVGSFQGPAGAQIVVDGFWDGGSVWRVRMAPTAVGPWSYQTTSSDPGLVASGAFNCVSSTSMGFLEVDPDHPHHFRWTSGEPFYFASTAIQLSHFDTRGAQGGSLRVDDGTFQAFLDTRASQGFTTTFWGYYGFNKPQFIDETQANEGGPPFVGYDPDVLNSSHFQYGDQRVLAALERGIVPHFIIGWPDQNIWGAIEESRLKRFWRYIIARYSAYNVVWNLFGEADEFGGAWLSIATNFGLMTRDLDPYDHLLTTHMSPIESSTHTLAQQSWVDLVVLQQEASSSDDYLVYGKPVVNSEYYGYEDFQVNGEQLRPLLWDVRMRGAYAVYESWGHDLHSPGATYAMWQNVFFQELTDYWLLEHHPELFGGSNGLAHPGEEYVLYLKHGGIATVDLTAAAGALDVTWYDPRNGQLQLAGEIAGGEPESFSAPSGQDWVLHIKRAPAGDGDGDGTGPPEDCDDSNPLVGPTAAEVCGNGIDDNCNDYLDEAPAEVTELTVAKLTHPHGSIEISWPAEVPTSDGTTDYDVARGRLSTLSTAWYGNATGCAADDLHDTPYVEHGAACPAGLGDGCWYLVRAQSPCGAGMYGIGVVGYALIGPPHPCP